VRSSTETADGVLRRALAPYLVDDVEARSGYYSVILGPTVPSRAGERPLSMLYADGVAVARSRSPRRVVRALAAYLAGHNGLAPPGGILRFDAVAAVGDRGAVLLPRGAFGHFDLRRFERELGRLGLRLVDSPHVDIDPETAEVIVGSSPLALDESALEELGPSGAEDAVPPGRYPLALWAVARPDEETGPPARAEAVAHGLTVVTGRPDAGGGQATAEGVAALAGRCTLVGFDASSMPATLAGISAALQAARIGQPAAAMRSSSATASPRSPLTSW